MKITVELTREDVTDLYSDREYYDRFTSYWNKVHRETGLYIRFKLTRKGKQRQ